MIPVVGLIGVAIAAVENLVKNDMVVIAAMDSADDGSRWNGRPPDTDNDWYWDAVAEAGTVAHLRIRNPLRDRTSLLPHEYYDTAAVSPHRIDRHVLHHSILLHYCYGDYTERIHPLEIDNSVRSKILVVRRFPSRPS